MYCLFRFISEDELITKRFLRQEPVLVTSDPKAISYICTNDDLFPRTEATKQVLQTVVSCQRDSFGLVLSIS